MKPVYLISNYHGTEVGKVMQKQKDGSQKTVNCHKALNCYNGNMCGMDKADIYCAIYGINRKNVTWWHRIFFGLIDRVITNDNGHRRTKNLGTVNFLPK